MARPGSIPALIADLFWPSDTTTQTAILLLLGLALVAVALVHLPLIVRLIRIGQLQRSVQACFEEESSNPIQRQEVANAFAESPLAYHWSDFVRRWQNAIAADPLQDASLPELSRAPVRLADVLDEHPLIPAGTRRSLLPALPAIFLSTGLLGAFAGLVLALPAIGLSLDPPSFDPATRSHQIGSLMDHLGMSLRIGLWGLLLSLGAAISGRLIEGRSDVLAETLDSWVQLAYGSISAGELATRTAHEQRMSLERLHDEVSELGRQLAGRPRPLIRSAAATPGIAPTSSVDSGAALRAVESLGERLPRELSQRVERSLAEQLSALRGSLSQAIAQLGSRPAESGPAAGAALGDAVDRLVKSSESQNQASESLSQTSRSVSDAALELRAGLDDLAAVIAQMRETDSSLSLTSQRVDGLEAKIEEIGREITAALARPQLAEPGLEPASSREPPWSGPEPEPAGTEAAPPPAAAPFPSPEADTLPYLKAPSPEAIDSHRRDRKDDSGDADSAGRGLSGLLRVTHHSGPSSDLPPDFDSESTLILEPSTTPSSPMPEPDADAEPGEADDAPRAAGAEPDDGEPSRRRGIFGRRK